MKSLTLFGFRLSIESCRPYEVLIYETPGTFVQIGFFRTLGQAQRASKRKLKQLSLDTDVNHYALIKLLGGDEPKLVRELRAMVKRKVIVK